MPTAPTLGCDFIDVPAVKARLWAAFDERALHVLHWSQPGSSLQDALKTADLPKASSLEPRALPEATRDLLDRYFRGEPVDPVTLPVEPSGTAFQLRVWSALRTIVRGQVRSYAGIASDVGKPRATRAVGAANGRNPIAIVIPCHRVVETGMHLGGYTGGLHIKRFLLELEGARVVGDRVQPGQLELL